MRGLETGIARAAHQVARSPSSFQVQLAQDDWLRLTPLSNHVPEEADTLMRKAYSLVPHAKITDLLLEVDQWTGFTKHFTHLKSNDPAGDRRLPSAASAPRSTLAYNFLRFARKPPILLLIFIPSFRAVSLGPTEVGGTAWTSTMPVPGFPHFSTREFT